MPEQVGAQASGFLIPHDHSDLAHGGILTEYSKWGAYRTAYSAGSTISIANDTERSKVAPFAWSVLKRIRVLSVVGGFQAGSFTIRYDYHGTLGTSFIYDMRVMRNGVQIDYFSNDVNTYATQTFTWTGTIQTGDVFELQVYSGDTGNDFYCRNFRIVFGWRIPYFGDGSSRVLSTPLTVTDTDNTLTTQNDDP